MPTPELAVATPRPDVLKRVFTCITLTLPEIAVIAGTFEHAGAVTLKANTYRLWDVGELREVATADEVIDRLSLVSRAPDGNELRFEFDSGYILVEATDPSLREAFERVTRYLAAKTANGTRHCLLVITQQADPAAAAAVTPARVSDVLGTVRPSRRMPAKVGRSTAWWWRAYALWVRLRLIGPTITPRRMLGLAAIACCIGVAVRKRELLVEHLHATSWTLLAVAMASAGIAHWLGRRERSHWRAQALLAQMASGPQHSPVAR